MLGILVAVKETTPLRLSEEERLAWRRDLYSHCEEFGFTIGKIGEAVGCTGPNISHMIGRGARKSKFLPLLDRWLIENIEPLLEARDPQAVLAEIFYDLEAICGESKTGSSPAPRLAIRAQTLRDSLRQIQGRLLRVLRTLEE